MTLTSAHYQEKNKLESEGAFKIFIKVQFDESTTIYFCDNNVMLTWDGINWNPIDIEIDSIEQNIKGDLPIFNLTLDNLDSAISPYLDETSGGQGTVVTLYTVNTNILSDPTPYTEIRLFVIGCNDDQNSVSFRLGMRNPTLKIYPPYRIMKKFCRYKTFKGPLCKYAGAETSCDRSLKTCKDVKGNQIRFGGFVSVGQGGYYG